MYVNANDVSMSILDALNIYGLVVGLFCYCHKIHDKNSKKLKFELSDSAAVFDECGAQQEHIPEVC